MPRKIDRSAFLYMDPSGPNQPQFAQCLTCRFFMPASNLCSLFVTYHDVKPGSTCGLYVPGLPSNAQPLTPTIWPKEAGFETRPVRCENCNWFNPLEQGCHLFYILNQQQPTIFDLDIKVHPLGCCNANTPPD